MKKFIFLLLILLCLNYVNAQLSFTDSTLICKQEDSLKTLATKIIMGQSHSIRFINDSLFTRLFVKALKTPYSFQYPFDSLQTISKLYASDNSFRIFTWQMVVSENLTRQHGAIQINTKDGSLKLFPLIDKSDVTNNINDTIADNKGWIGAVYYKLITKLFNNKPYYTLLGYDENNIRSNRKIIDVLTFENDLPVFGSHIFTFENDAKDLTSISRYVMEFKKEAGARLNYDEDLDMIIAEHLESETGEKNKKWTYIPDGDYEGFTWKNGQWIHIAKVFTQVTPEGKAPTPAPIKEETEKTMEQQLQEAFPDKDIEPVQQPVKKVSKKKSKH